MQYAPQTLQLFSCSPPLGTGCYLRNFDKNDKRLRLLLRLRIKKFLNFNTTIATLKITV